MNRAQNISNCPIAVFIFLLAFLSQLPGFGQQGDSIAIKPRSTDSTGIHVFQAAKKKIRPAAYAVPTGMMLYGFLAMHIDALTDINETVKQKVYTDRRPHDTNVDNYLQYAPGLAVYGLNLVGIHGKNNLRDRTILLGMSSLIMAGVVNLTKSITGEIRPDGSDNLSFPSGHTATAFMTAEFLRQEYQDVSPWICVAGYASAAVTGYMRISNNKHWFGDVVAGAGAGMISTRVAYWIYPTIKKKLFHDRELKTIAMPYYQAHVFGLAFQHHF